MRPKCKRCKRAGNRLSSQVRKSGKRNWKGSPYYICPECGEIVNIKCNSGKIKIMKVKDSKPKSVKPKDDDSDIDWSTFK